MKIGIDARPLTVRNFAGISNYLYRICKEWMVHNPENEYYLMARNPICFKEDELPSNWHIINEPWIIDKGTITWFMFKLPSLIKKYNLDVFWSPNYVLPKKVRKTRYYVTIHDLAIYKFKGIGKFRNTAQIKLLLPSSIRKSDCVIAISNSTKQDIISQFNANPDKIKVTYEAASLDEVDYDVNNISSTIQELSNEEYVLFIGTIEPRKNIKTIVEGFEKYRDNHEKSHLKLVLAGGKGWGYADIFGKIFSSKYSDDIVTTGYINEQEKRFLLENMKAFVFPSEYEGFGLPVLEAFGCGKNAILSKVPALIEVGGDAALYIDTHDSDDLANKIQQAITLGGNEQQISKLKEQFGKYSWNKCATETLELFRE